MNALQIKEILQLYSCDDKIDIADIEAIQDMQERKNLLEQHDHKIWEKEGRYFTYLPDKTKERGVKLCKRKTREELEDAIVNFYKDYVEDPTIEEVFTEWNDKRLESKNIVEATHLRNKQCFNRYFSEFGKKSIKKVRPIEFQDFLEEQISKYSLSPRGFSNLKSIVRGFLKRAKKKGLISFNVDEMINDMDVTERSFKRKRKKDEEEVFFDDEVEKIISYIKENPTTNNLAVALMFATGMRVGEVVALKHSDFNGMTVKIERSETCYQLESGKYIREIQDHPKTEAGFRTIIIPDSYKWVVDKLKSRNPFGEWVFTKKDGKTRCNTNTIRTRVREICKYLGMPVRSSHKIRKTYGTILLDNNVDTKLIQSQMGHTNISITENFYHRDRKKIDQKRQIINSISEFAG